MPKANKKSQHFCSFCNKEFLRESSIIAHSCVKKMRWQDKDNEHSVMGFRTYQLFYKLTNDREISFEHFINSQLYCDFLSFGKWLNEQLIFDCDSYIEYLVLGNFKIKDWSKKSVYETFLKIYLIKEDPVIAVVRTIEFMSEYCEIKNIELQDFYKDSVTTWVIDNLRNGRISPWLFFTSQKSETLLNRFDSSQYKLLGNLLDNSAWSLRFNKCKTEIAECKELLKEMDM